VPSGAPRCTQNSRIFPNIPEYSPNLPRTSPKISEDPQRSPKTSHKVKWMISDPPHKGLIWLSGTFIKVRRGNIISSLCPVAPIIIRSGTSMEGPNREYHPKTVLNSRQRAIGDFHERTGLRGFIRTLGAFSQTTPTVSRSLLGALIKGPTVGAFLSETYARNFFKI
jgi:hypothetical protein